MSPLASIYLPSKGTTYIVIAVQVWVELTVNLCRLDPAKCLLPFPVSSNLCAHCMHKAFVSRAYSHTLDKVVQASCHLGARKDTTHKVATKKNKAQILQRYRTSDPQPGIRPYNNIPDPVASNRCICILGA